MKKLITDDLGGHPVYFKDFEFVQEQIRELAQATFGFLSDTIVTILSGCEVEVDSSGTATLSEGWVYYDGELFQVDAAEIYRESADYVLKWYIQTSYDSRGAKEFKDESNHSVYAVRKMVLIYKAESVAGALFSESEYYSAKIGGMPVGGIIMWSGTTIPSGYALCNGQTVNGYTTPDLKGRFVVGYSTEYYDYLEPGNLSEKGTNKGNTGGETEVTLTAAQSGLPAHKHTAEIENTATVQYAGSVATGIESSQNVTIQLCEPTITVSNCDKKDAGSAHENRPPYYVLAYIMRVK